MKKNNNLRYILWRIDVKAVAMLLAVVLAIAGILMIYADIRDEGFIDISSAFIKGQLKTGFVGVIIIFVSMIIALGCIVARWMSKPDMIELKIGDTILTWKGDTVNFDHELANILIEGFKKLVEILETKKTLHSVDLVEKPDDNIKNT